MKVRVCIATDIEVEVEDKFSALATDYTQTLADELSDNLCDKLCRSTVVLHGVQVDAVYTMDDMPLVEY